MIEALLGPPVASYEMFGDVDSPDLFPQEAASIAHAVPIRRREFATARTCARRALGQLGYAPMPIPVGERGAPQWPADVVGSITHCAGYRVAAVGRATAIRSIGIDAEPNLALPDGVLEAVTLHAERCQVRELLLEVPAVRWDRLVFSVKESVYKCWYQLCHRPLEFEDVEVRFDPDRMEFTASLLVSAAAAEQLLSFTGNCIATEQYLLSGVTAA